MKTTLDGAITKSYLPLILDINLYLLLVLGQFVQAFPEDKSFLTILFNSGFIVLCKPKHLFVINIITFNYSNEQYHDLHQVPRLVI